jgi:hypothetical protein
MSSYAESLRSPQWDALRKRMLHLVGYKCESCGASRGGLQVHHKLYRRGHAAWEYEEYELAVLCPQCHERIHAAREQLDQSLASIDEESLALGLWAVAVFAELIGKDSKCKDARRRIRTTADAIKRLRNTKRLPDVMVAARQQFADPATNPPGLNDLGRTLGSPSAPLLDVSPFAADPAPEKCDGHEIGTRSVECDRCLAFVQRVMDHPAVPNVAGTVAKSLSFWDKALADFRFCDFDTILVPRGKADA